MTKSIAMQHDVDPRQEIYDTINKAGGLKGFELFGNQVLLAVYKRPEKTKSGLILTNTTRQEDDYQGKAALVLAKGPAAFKSDDNYDFMGQTVNEGEWVAIFVSDGRKIMIGEQLCRLCEDQHIRLRIPAPDIIY